MRPLNLRVCVLSVSAAFLFNATARCQAQANNAVGPKPAEAAASWPSTLLLAGVPGKENKVPMGISHKRALELAKQFYPNNVKFALRLLKNVSSELGEKDVPVEPCYLSKYAITNEQYLRFVKATGARFPYHWWRDGKKTHFDEARPKVRKAYPDLPADERVNAPLYYWEFNWKSEKLPYAIPAGTEKHPVVFVSWNDAVRFAAWAGMRLPTEAEWTLAANGGERRDFVFGDWNPKALEALKMVNKRDIMLRPAGALGPKSAGPFGHLDMVGQVWEWVIPLGYEPQTSRKLFEMEYAKLRKDKKYGPRLKASPHFKPEFAIAKGGSFFSFSTEDFIQTRINCRAPLMQEQTLPSLGFRVAKSKRAAYDMSLARLKIDYPAFMPGNKEPHLPSQVGIERYDLENGGELIADYHAVSIIPTNFASLKPKLGHPQLIAASQERPLLTSIMITTAELATPTLKKGVYGVYYRAAGIPRTLLDALKQGHRVLAAEAKAKAKAEKASSKRKPSKKKKKDDEKKKDQKKNKKKKNDRKWEAVLAKYGYTNKEVAENKVSDLAKYVYVRHTGLKEGDKDKLFKVSTENAQYLFREKSGKWVSAIPTKAKLPRPSSKPVLSTVTGPVTEKGASKVTFSYGVMQDQREFEKKKSGRAIPFTFEIELLKTWN